MADIKFYIPEGQIIPESMKLKYNNKVVYYFKDTCYTYSFCYPRTEGWTDEEAETATKEIADLLVKQNKIWENWLINKIERIDDGHQIIQYRVEFFVTLRKD